MDPHKPGERIQSKPLYSRQEFTAIAGGLHQALWTLLWKADPARVHSTNIAVGICLIALSFATVDTFREKHLEDIIEQLRKEVKSARAAIEGLREKEPLGGTPDSGIPPI